MSWLRKGYVYSFVGGALVVWALVFFLFDPLLKRAIVAAGQTAAGAKVDIDSLDTSWRKGLLEIKSIAVADRDAPMKNLFELSRAGFRLDPSALLRGKAVIREAALEGLRFNTARKTSGELPRPPEPGKLEKLIKDKIAPPGTVPSVGDVKENAAAEVDAAKLEGVKKLDEAKAKAAELESRWKGKEAEAKAIEKEARELSEQVKALGKGGSAPADVLKKAAEAKAAQDKIKALIARVDEQRTQARRDIEEAQGLLRQADELRKKDIGGLLAAAGLPSLDAQDLARRLLGAQAASRLALVMRWMRAARERAAASKAATPPPPPRRKGVDVEFPREHVYPQFLLEGAKIDGALDAFGGLGLKGGLTGFTSNPKLYGKPALLNLAGRSLGGQGVSLAGRLDQQADPVGVTLEFSGSGFPLAGATLGDGQVGAELREGLGAARGRLSCAGDLWTGEITFTASKVSLEPKVSLGGTAGALVSDALRSLPGFEVKVSVAGREDDLKLGFSSNAGDAVAAAMRKAVSAQLETQRKALEAKVDALYAGKRRELEARTEELRKKALAPLDAQREALDRQLKEAISKAVGQPKIPQLDKLFRR